MSTRDSSPSPDTGRARAHAPAPHLIPRFQSAERWLHWALALPFVLLYLTALGMAIFYGEPAPRLVRGIFANAHRALGLALAVLPPIALIAGWRGWRAHVENLREGWRWTRDDVRWLLLFPKAALNPKVALPEQGKFNAAEKLNFMMVTATYPFYVITGLLVWMPGVAIFSYLAHLGVALLGLPLVMGHIFMATVNPDTRVGLSGMFTGWVDREWAKHHYRRWFRDRIEAVEQAEAARAFQPLLHEPARVRCRSCEGVHAHGTWLELIQRSFRVEPVTCPSCETPIALVGGVAKPADALVRHLETRGAEVAFEPEGVAAA